MKPNKVFASVLCLALILSACGQRAQPPALEAVQPPAEAATAVSPIAVDEVATAAPTAAVAAEPATGATATTGKTADAESPEPHGLRYDAPEYAVDGPYAVGVRYFTIPTATESDRDLTVNIWYPAQQSDSVPSEMVYEQQFAPGEIPAFTVIGHAQLDAPPDASGAPYPLVVYSHAHWSFGQETPYFAAHLASRGFVVISADHEDNWSTAFGPIAPQAYFRRPQEITRQIDYAEDLSADSGLLPGFISTNQVGVAGWSQGAMTALAAAGARLNLANAAAWCQDNPDTAELNTTACPDLVGREAELAAFAGLDETPAGLWPDWSDERVGAVVAMAPSTIPFGKEGMQSVNAPVIFLIGSGETSVDEGFEMASPYESVVSESKAKVVFDYGEHLLFNGSCADSPSIVELGFPMFCTDPVWDMDRAHDLVNHFATAFLLAELKGDAEAAKALAPENVDFPGIKYESAGYGAAPTAKLDDATVTKIEAQVKEIMAKGQVPGAAVGIVKDGELVYASGFGVRELGSDKPVTPDSVFPTGSIAKTPVAVAIMQLVEDGKIDLDTPVTKYLPYFTLADPDAGAITIRQLLSHTSGMPDTIDWLSEYQDKNKRIDDGVLDDYIRSLSKESLLFRPGKDWAYSSIGFDILGDVVAKVSGQSFEDYVQAHVLTPLGMDDSSYLLGDVNPAKLVAPHMYDENGKAKTLDFYPYSRTHAPSGAFYSNVNDMARFAIANMNQGALDGTRVLPASAYDKMWAPQAASPWAESFGPQVNSYGLGWWVGEFMDHPLIGNYGTEFGFQSHLGILPEDGMAVIALVNLFDPEAGSFYAYDIGNGIAEVLLGLEPEAEPAAKLDAATVAKIEALVEKTMQVNNVPGFALSVVKDGELAYAKGFGVTNIETEEPVTSRTLFQLAETSMMPTAIAVSQLVEQGKLDLDTPVADYLPYFKMKDESYKEITVRHLLTHQSGIPDSGDQMADWGNFKPEYDAGATERWVRTLTDMGLLFAPGSGFEYSDLGYALLGDVIAKAGGQSYDEYVQENILGPLGMESSSYLLEEIDRGLLASPHVVKVNENVVSEALPYHRAFAATNNLFSSAEEMARLVAAALGRGELDGTRILSEAAWDEMWTTHAATPYGEYPFGTVYPSRVMQDWGYGWFIGNVEGHTAYTTFGREQGYNSAITVVPDEGIAVIAMGNGPVLEGYYASDTAVDVIGSLLNQ